jgi:flotillin
MRDSSFLEKACEQFLGKSVKEVERVILQTLEGHLRAILGKLPVICLSV